jgi:tetratricopeptide (TPR) repeat protein
MNGMDSKTAPSSTTFAPTPDQLAQITKLYDAGLYVQAYRASEAIGPLRRWVGTDARLLAARMATNLGAPDLGRQLILAVWRNDRAHPQACWFYARQLLDSRGPWAAMQFMRPLGTFADATARDRAYWLSLYAQVYGRARDFENSAKWLAQAEAVCGDDPWVLLERAALLSMEDREEEAIGAARRALEIQPWHRAAVQWLAHFLVQNEQDDEALRFLQDASERIESYAVTSQLANLQLETERFAEARASFEKCAELAPLLDKTGAQWLAARRCDAAYFCGDLEKAGQWAKETIGRFYEVQAERFANPPAGGKRVCLPVGFVRQHHWTCAPATMAAICRFSAMGDRQWLVYQGIYRHLGQRQDRARRGHPVQLHNARGNQLAPSGSDRL